MRRGNLETMTVKLEPETVERVRDAVVALEGEGMTISRFFEEAAVRQLHVLSKRHGPFPPRGDREPRTGRPPKNVR